MVQTKLPSVYDDVFTLTPSPLKTVCLETLSNELPKLTTTQVSFLGNNKFDTTKKFSQNIPIPDKIAESLIETFSKKGLISDETLSLFTDISQYNLKSLRLPNINMVVSGKTLLKYRYFSFQELILGCNLSANRWSMTKLCESFIGSRCTLTRLKIDLYPAVKIASGSPFDFFVQFPNLQHLVYNSPINKDKLMFTNNNWQALLEACSSLKSLHVYVNGPCEDLELDSKCFLSGQRLESLTLFSVLKSETAIKSFECVQHFLELENLRELDLSIDLDPPETNIIDLNLYEQNLETPSERLGKYIDKFLELSFGKLLHLESLDLSAIYKIEDSRLTEFIETHKKLRFIGLCMLQSKFCVNGDFAAFYSHLKVLFFLILNF